MGQGCEAGFTVNPRILEGLTRARKKSHVDFLAGQVTFKAYLMANEQVLTLQTLRSKIVFLFVAPIHFLQK